MIIRIMQMIITMAIIIVRDNNSNNKRERERENKVYKYSNSPIENALTVFEGAMMFIELYITASLPYDFVLKDFTLRIPFLEHHILYLCDLKKKQTNY